MSRAQRLRLISVVAVVALTATMVAGCGVVTRDDTADGYGVSGGPSPETMDLESTTNGYEESAAEDSRAGTVPESDRMIIRSKRLRLEVISTTDTVNSIRSLVTTHGGTVTNLQMASDTDEPVYYYERSSDYSSGALRGWVTVRLPAESLEAFFTEATRLGTVKYQSEASDDVTQEHVDLAARLANLRAEEARLREFFDSAKNVTEMLSIEQELSRVRGEIESLDAQVKYLERQAALATVTIELIEPKDLVRPDGESWGFADAITDGFRGAAGVVKVTITFAIATAPIWAFGIVVFLIVRAIVRHRRTRRTPPSASDDDSHPGEDVAGTAGSPSP